MARAAVARSLKAIVMDFVGVCWWKLVVEVRCSVGVLVLLMRCDEECFETTKRQN
jgi:hypothetical protein